MLLSPTALRSAFKVSLTSLIETSFIELPPGFSGKSPAVVGEAWRCRIRKLCAAGEQPGDIAHLETRNSISLFIRFVNHYFALYSHPPGSLLLFSPCRPWNRDSPQSLAANCLSAGCGVFSVSGGTVLS